MGIRLYIYIFASVFFVLECNSQTRDNLFINTYKKTDETNRLQNLSNDFNIAFLLPFCLDNNTILSIENLDSLLNINESLLNHDFYKKTKISIDFFLGFLLSLNEFSNLNISISLFDIKDGDESQAVLQSIVKSRELNNMDLIVGPLFTDNFLFFADIFNKKIPIISPFSKKQNIIHNNENVFQLETSLLNQLSVFSTHIYEEHFNDHILMVRQDTIFQSVIIRAEDLNNDNYSIDTILPNDITYSKVFYNHMDTSLINFEEVLVQSNVIDSIYHKLDTLGMRNIVIIPSDDHVFVTDLLSKLHACRDTGMIVYTLPILSDFAHISVYDLMDMKVTFPHNENFNNTMIKEFIINFYNNNDYFPNLKYSKVGYDVGIYFLDFLSIYGEILPYIDEDLSKTILGTEYKFKKENNSGYRNNSTLILRYNNFGYSIIY